MFCRNGASSNQPAAPDGDDEGVYAGTVRQDFGCRGTLVRDDLIVVIGMNDNGAGLCRDLLGAGRSFHDANAMEHNFGPEFLGSGDFQQRCGNRHYDGRPDTEA